MITIAQAKQFARRFEAVPARPKVVSLMQLMEVLARIAPATPTFVVTRTEAREIYKMGCPFHDVHAVKRRQVQFNLPYEEAVNRRRVQEHRKPDFAALGRSWGSRLTLPFVSHMDRRTGQIKVYASLHVIKNLGVEYYDGGGLLIPRRALEPYFKPPRKGGERQGLDRPIQYRDYELPHILQVQIQGPRGGLQGYIPELP